jgi:hypothetical protein
MGRFSAFGSFVFSALRHFLSSHWLDRRLKAIAALRNSGAIPSQGFPQPKRCLAGSILPRSASLL